jgi:hypothetical protein
MKRLLTTMRPNRKTLSCLLLIVCCMFDTPSFAAVQGQPAAFTFYDRRIGAFVISDSGRLYRVVIYFDYLGQVESVVWEDSNGTQLRPTVSALNPQLAFVIGSDGNLYAKYWDGNAWQWSYQGSPGVTLSGSVPTWVFAIGGNGRFYAIRGDIKTNFCWERQAIDLSAYPGAP